MSAVLKKELRSYFTTPIGYVFLAIFVFFSGWFLKDDLLLNGSSNFSIMYNAMFIINMFLIPILTMRLLSEDKRQKTDQLLITSPNSPLGIIMGKYLAAVIMYLTACSVYVIEALIVRTQGLVDWNIFLSGLLGSILLGAAFISIGMFISSLTESQVVASVGTFAVSMFMMMLETFRPENNELINAVIDWISFGKRYSGFLIGIFSYADAVFFLSIIAVFIFLTVRLQEKKRWS